MRMGAPRKATPCTVMLSTARVRTDAIRRSEPRDFNFSLAASRGCDPPQCRRWWTRRAVATRRFGRLTNLPHRGSFAAAPLNRSKELWCQLEIRDRPCRKAGQLFWRHLIIFNPRSSLLHQPPPALLRLLR
jgi:hypothetical protein